MTALESLAARRRLLQLLALPAAKISESGAKAREASRFSFARLGKSPYDLVDWGDRSRESWNLSTPSIGQTLSTHVPALQFSVNRDSARRVEMFGKPGKGPSQWSKLVRSRRAVVAPGVDSHWWNSWW
jgi:hypothetical protein